MIFWSQNEKGICVIAGDISPIDVISHVPIFCEEKEVLLVSKRLRRLKGLVKYDPPLACDPGGIHLRPFETRLGSGRLNQATHFGCAGAVQERLRGERAFWEDFKRSPESHALVQEMISTRNSADVNDNKLMAWRVSISSFLIAARQLFFFLLVPLE